MGLRPCDRSVAERRWGPRLSSHQAQMGRPAPSAEAWPPPPPPSLLHLLVTPGPSPRPSKPRFPHRQGSVTATVHSGREVGGHVCLVFSLLPYCRRRANMQNRQGQA